MIPKKYLEKWAQNLAGLVEPNHEAGWAIYEDWLNAFVADTFDKAERGNIVWVGFFEGDLCSIFATRELAHRWLIKTRNRELELTQDVGDIRIYPNREAFCSDDAEWSIYPQKILHYPT